MSDSHITSLSNPRVKQVVKLRDRQHRESVGLTIVDGRKELSRALESGLKISELYICEQGLDETGAVLVAKAREQSATCFSVSSEAFEKMAYGGRKEGVLAVVSTPETALESWALVPGARAGVPLLVVVEGIEKPGNLGALLRSADAAGATGVIVCDPRTDLFNPNAIRASLGTIFTVPLAQAPSQDALSWLRERGIRTFAASPTASRPYTEAEFTSPSAIVLGTEHEGLSRLWLEGSDFQISIPMKGHADSLNLAMAATVLLFEAARQRSLVVP